MILELYSQVNDLVVMGIIKKRGRCHYKLVCSHGHSVEVRSDSLKDTRTCKVCHKKAKRLASLRRSPRVYEGYTKGQLKVLGILPKQPYDHSKVLTLCTCGNMQEMYVDNLLKTTQSWSCGRCSPYYKYVEDTLRMYFEGTDYKFELIVDAEDAYLVMNTSWTVHRGSANNYIRAVSGDRTFLHRVLTNCPDDKFVDHINGDGLDNRKCNLRVVTKEENARNMAVGKSNTSGKLGVTYRKDTGKWRVYINGQDGRVDLGSFYNKEDAILKREEAEVFYGYHENHGREQVIQNILDKVQTDEL